ncbi:hypothetical protein DFP72DRAFT_841439 [Ephemerocybe angulata]|uniref:Uncharacterized protein n=1 Tax=Ephemerocybe angulata TaxID=980116 RepID=A0A8H6ID24_9AGAR|nr:hypothetical protein DFP72DRAFT_841439 [Tulosesus angulatus]
MLGIPLFSSPTLWDSLIQYTTFRREKYLDFVHRNHASGVLDKRLIELFHTDIDISLTIHGLLSTLVEYNMRSKPLRTLMKRLHLHDGSDEDIWAALGAGCFLDGGEGLQGSILSSCPYEIGEWWRAELPRPTLASVFEDWAEAYERTHGIIPQGPSGPHQDSHLPDRDSAGASRLSGTAVPELESVLKTVIATIDLNIEDLRQHTDALAQARPALRTLQSHYGLDSDMYM